MAQAYSFMAEQPKTQVNPNLMMEPSLQGGTQSAAAQQNPYQQFSRASQQPQVNPNLMMDPRFQGGTNSAYARESQQPAFRGQQAQGPGGWASGRAMNSVPRWTGGGQPDYNAPGAPQQPQGGQVGIASVAPGQPFSKAWVPYGGTGGGGTGGGGTGGGGWNLPQWNPSAPSRFQAGVPDPGTPREGGGSWWLGQGGMGGTDRLFNPGSFNEPNTPYARMLENSLPWAQFTQNASQYQSDFNEAQRRWNTETGWGQSMDQWNANLAGRQQMSAEEQARVAAQQWQDQFGWTQTTDQWNRDLSQQGITNTAAYQQGLLGNSANEIANTAKYQSGLLSNQQTEMANTRDWQQGQLANTQFSNQATAQYQQGLVANQQQANQIENAYRTGLISNEQRSLALQELTQQQTYGLQGRAQSEVERAAQVQEAMRQQEINQQMQIAAMQTYGRSQAPTRRWARSWA